jgi:hypothetical protein
VATEVTVPLLIAAIVMEPAPLVTVIPVPGVIAVATGAAPVDPTKIWPLVNAAASTIAPPDETIIRLLFRAVEELVPPFAMGRIPETWVASPILPHEGAVPIPPEIKAFPVATSANLDKVVAALAYNKSPIV